MTESIEVDGFEGLDIEDRLLIGRATIGADLKKFITEDTAGKYLMQRAREVYDEALTGISKADVTNQSEHIALQREIRAPEIVMTWVNEGIVDGQQAEDTINEAGT